VEANPCDPFLVPVPCEPSTAAPAYVPSGPVPDYKDVPGGTANSDGVELMLTPRLTIAPVGSDVVLLAGVLGADRYLRTNQRIEWTIESGVGQFVDLGGKSAFDWLVGDFTRPRKTSATAAVGTTTREYLRLNRGTPNPDDDVQVLRGQAWITVTSPVEGISYVTAYSPCVGNWAARKQTAAIHWVNAQWCFPPPAINPAGTSHVFTTTVTRQTDQTPCEGWLVRYEILDGPAAGFAPDGAQAVEVPTDAAGHAGVEIFQIEPAPGVNRIGIQVIRPAAIDGAAGRRLVVGSGTTSKSWTSADVAVRKSGPATAAVGSTMTYHIDVTNPGDLPADGVVVSDEIPDGTTYLSSNPAGQVSGRSIRWQPGRLAAGQTLALEVQLRAERQGSVTSCAEASIPSGLKARDCVSTTIGVPAIDVAMQGPTQATVGGEVEFVVVVTNRGQSPLGGLKIKDRFDAGLEHAEARSPIERDLGEILAGQSRSIGVAFRVTKTGRLCHTVEILGPGGVLGTATACVVAAAATAGQPQIQPQPQPQPQPPIGVSPSLSLKLAGPERRTVGETAHFTMDVVNTSTETVRQLRLLSLLDPSFEPSLASPGWKLEGDAVWWPIDQIAPGETVGLQIEARCVSPAQNACHQVRVMQGERVLAEEETYMRILSAPMFAPASLSMTIEDWDDPITVGRQKTFEIRVDNSGQLPDQDVVVVVTLPPAMAVVPLRTWGPDGYDVDAQTIRFHPVSQIEPGGSIVYRVRAQTKLPGMATLRAQLTSRRLEQPLVISEETNLLPAQ